MGKKNPEQSRMINNALFMLESFGVPTSEMTTRQRIKMAMGFLALANMRRGKRWPDAQDVTTVKLGTKDIIRYVNKHFNEKISLGSYDDIRRKDLKPLLQAGIVERSKPDSAMNDPARGYGISTAYCTVIRVFQSDAWDAKLADVKTRSKMVLERGTRRISVSIPNKENVYLSLGDHNDLQKKIVSEMLPVFCPSDVEILYLGDSAKKQIVNERDKLKRLGISEMGHGLLPDIIAYSTARDWIYMVEAFNTSNPISNTRKADLEKLVEGCSAKVMFVTAFLDRTAFRKEIANIAWATDVWLADTPEHMIHFNGARFLEPY